MPGSRLSLLLRAPASPPAIFSPQKACSVPGQGRSVTLEDLGSLGSGVRVAEPTGAGRASFLARRRGRSEGEKRGGPQSRPQPRFSPYMTLS
jgi:hypothetical protein